ncbi:hypothetical protein [Chromatocurvus halotolerans]|uniref:Uncharacterized protein n=1 Tax=Chromatocurvus halotolerans TaxID=1132028 RepID=A0A4R2KHM3_9GAMM|nr:hypothetical protein [Chromatocurvus halotolerans]TCO71857.1 hypothetical protein EV688_12011 [Chromatocurvus halotolerans]
MTAMFERCTTEYIEAQDRLRLSAQLANGDTVVLWLTQRLLNRLVPHLIAWLERQTAGVSTIPSVRATQTEAIQGFAQQAAGAQMKGELPVQAQSALTSWLVDVVDVAPGEDAVVLTFKSEQTRQAAVKLPAQQLRQWLGIVYRQYQRGEWPTAVWPEWVKESGQLRGDPGGLVMH